MANEFTPDDAQAIVNICRSAPLPHLDEAQRRMALLSKFVAWCNDIFEPTPLAPRQPAQEPDKRLNGAVEDPRVPTAAAMRAAGIRPLGPQE
jgi:hypothetical protein